MDAFCPGICGRRTRVPGTPARQSRFLVPNEVRIDGSNDRKPVVILDTDSSGNADIAYVGHRRSQAICRSARTEAVIRLLIMCGKFQQLIACGPRLFQGWAGASLPSEEDKY